MCRTLKIELSLKIRYIRYFGVKLSCVCITFAKRKKSKVTYSNPRVTFSDPKMTYSDPKMTYSDPRVTYSAPRVTYSDPKVTFTLR